MPEQPLTPAPEKRMEPKGFKSLESWISDVTQTKRKDGTIIRFAPNARMIRAEYSAIRQTHEPRLTKYLYVEQGKNQTKVLFDEMLFVILFERVIENSENKEMERQRRAGKDEWSYTKETIAAHKEYIAAKKNAFSSEVRAEYENIVALLQPR